VDLLQSHTDEAVIWLEKGAQRHSGAPGHPRQSRLRLDVSDHPPLSVGFLHRKIATAHTDREAAGCA
jgi:hypothetical protein